MSNEERIAELELVVRALIGMLSWEALNKRDAQELLVKLNRVMAAGR